MKEIPNDPNRVRYASTGRPIPRASGTTPSEALVAKLAEHSFLNLWSYPNTFIDKRLGPNGPGKELCDLIVVCGDHVLVFSIKDISWPDSGNVERDWRRWYRRAIESSVKQIRGAERWLTDFPSRVFIDRDCTVPFPIDLPTIERRKFHGIAVALGGGHAASKHFGTPNSSLVLNFHIKDSEHFEGKGVLPFQIGDVSSDGSFIHVLDDNTLEIALGELDTISDFAEYLEKKALRIRNRQLAMAGGEEDLIAQYATTMGADGKHDFANFSSKHFPADAEIMVAPGTYADFVASPEYQARKSADQVSYVWDGLISLFAKHLLAGTSVSPDGQTPTDLRTVEQGIRHMALVPRFLRRSFGEAIHGAMDRGRSVSRFARGLFPPRGSQDDDTGFFFMTLAVPARELPDGYIGYRKARSSMLETYAFAMLNKYRHLKRIIGIGVEPPSARGGSEDLIYVEPPTEWTDDLLLDLEERKTQHDAMQERTYREYGVHVREYPKLPTSSAPETANLNRHERRKRKAVLRAKGKLAD